MFSSATRQHPEQWPVLRKCYDSALIVFLEFFVTMISNTCFLVAKYAEDDFGISREIAPICFTTVYLLGQALSGLLFPPICESFGGRTVYVGSTIGFAASCLLIAAWPHLVAVVLGRFISGLMSAMPGVVATGSIENM